MMVIARPAPKRSVASVQQAPHPVTTDAGFVNAPTRVATATAGSAGRIAVQGGPIALTLWKAQSANEAAVHGRVTLGGKPVQGARIGMDRFTLPGATDASGG